MPARNSLVSLDGIDRRIHTVHGQRVMLERDLARLYGVTTFNLNKAVGRNLERFPGDFSFVVPWKDLGNLIFQTGISSSHGGSRKPVRVFTEHGVAVLSSVLRSPRAIQANIAIMRAFSRFRKMLAAHELLAGRLLEMEKNCDARFKHVSEVLRLLVTPPEGPPKERIGFRTAKARSKIQAVRGRLSR
ncbi:MAG TPA: ORF6N domain-containing protein [Planctomycetota bacterium]|nr:ORF6N domain-containing protein [Planctomycetota bacterium]